MEDKMEDEIEAGVEDSDTDAIAGKTIADDVITDEDSGFADVPPLKGKIDKRQIMKLREKTHMLEPVIRIGKNGINDNVIKEIVTLLKKRRLIKIKVLKNSLENNELDGLISEVTQKTSSTLIVKIGLVFCIYR